MQGAENNIRNALDPPPPLVAFLIVGVLPGTIVGGVVPVHAGGPTGDGAGDYHPHSLDRWASGSNYSAGARGPIDSRALGLGCLCPTAGPPSAPG